MLTSLSADSFVSWNNQKESLVIQRLYGVIHHINFTKLMVSHDLPRSRLTNLITTNIPMVVSFSMFCCLRVDTYCHVLEGDHPLSHWPKVG